jgi:uncharacterized protein (DUF488 family)
MTPTRPILTIGHSRHSWERFTTLLAGAGVELIADIRTAPRSRFSPQFNKDTMAAALAARGVEYIFLGKELGGRPQSQELYTDGVADYEKMAASPEFRLGLERLMEASAHRSVAAMCSEADPLECHQVPARRPRACRAGRRCQAHSRLRHDRDACRGGRKAPFA